MKSKPLISIVIPFYNKLDLLYKSLDSVYHQSYTNYEIILIDDHSNQQLNIDSIKKKFFDNQIVYKRLDCNRGPGFARGQGRKLARGKYIAYLDSDDEWHPTFLEETAAILHSNPLVSMVFTNSIIKQNSTERLRLSIDSGNYNFFELVLKENLYWATGAALWRANISKSQNWKETRDHEDYLHDFFSLYVQPEIFHINTPLIIINKNSDIGIRRSSKEMLKSFLLLLNNKNLKQRLKETRKDNELLFFLIKKMKKRKYNILHLILLLNFYLKGLSWSKSKLTFTKKVLGLFLK